MMGESANNHFNSNLREAKGWTYGAYAFLADNPYSGTSTFYAGSRTDATDSALSEIIKEIKLYASTGITEDELKFTKNAIGLFNALLYETGPQKADFIGLILDYNLTRDFAEIQNRILSSISKNEIDMLSKKWLMLDKRNIVLVVDMSQILPGLQKQG